MRGVGPAVLVVDRAALVVLAGIVVLVVVLVAAELVEGEGVDPVVGALLLLVQQLEALLQVLPCTGGHNISVDF